MKVEFRDLASVDELKEAEELQRKVWGYNDIPDNSDMMLAIQHEGGLVGGAFAEGKLLGFIFAFPTASQGVQHSHRLAVLPEARGLKLGSRLKWYQRDWCLARGIHHVRWTYDPLRAVNAALNISGLGAVASVYHTDYYGKMVGINAGLPSDRIVADWYLTSQAVAKRAEHQSTALAKGRRIGLPRDLDALMASDPAAALKERLSLRQKLQEAFAKGEIIQDFDRQTAEYILA